MFDVVCHLQRGREVTRRGGKVLRTYLHFLGHSELNSYSKISENPLRSFWAYCPSVCYLCAFYESNYNTPLNFQKTPKSGRNRDLKPECWLEKGCRAVQVEESRRESSGGLWNCTFSVCLRTLRQNSVSAKYMFSGLWKVAFPHATNPH